MLTVRKVKPFTKNFRRKKATDNSIFIRSKRAEKNIDAGQRVIFKSQWLNVKTLKYTFKSPMQQNRVFNKQEKYTEMKVPTHFLEGFPDCQIEERYRDNIPTQLHPGVRKVDNYMLVKEKPHSDGTPVLIKAIPQLFEHSCEPNLSFPPYQPNMSRGIWECYAQCQIKRGENFKLDLIPDSLYEVRQAELKHYGQQCHNPACSLCHEKKGLLYTISGMIFSFKEHLPRFFG